MSDEREKFDKWRSEFEDPLDDDPWEAWQAGRKSGLTDAFNACKGHVLAWAAMREILALIPSEKDTQNNP